MCGSCELLWSAGWLTAGVETSQLPCVRVGSKTNINTGKHKQQRRMWCGGMCQRPRVNIVPGAEEGMRWLLVLAACGVGGGGDGGGGL